MPWRVSAGMGMPARSALRSDMTCQPSWLVSPACAGPIAPAASYGVLGGDRIADRPADRLPQAGIVRHSERFAQGAGRHAVAVHDFVAGGLTRQIAVGAPGFP